jgi:hypothetical protein
LHSRYHKHITTYTQYTRILRGNPNERKPRNVFLIYQNITFIGSTNFQNSPAATGRKHQPPVYRLQPEGSYNSLNFPAPTGKRFHPLVYRIQPEGSYNSLSFPIEYK